MITLQLLLIPVSANFENRRNYILESIKQVFIQAKIILFPLEDSGNLGGVNCDLLEIPALDSFHTDHSQ